MALPLLAEAVRLESVTFSYTGERTELCDVSLELRAGTSTAIVGPSGSGKSTALSLITRAIQPQSGRVLLDGRDLAEAIPATLYDQMAIVAQESLLFNTSIRDNIRIGRLDATDAEVEGAARMAEIHDVIVALPRGYETSVGERGGSLSGGQRQRLAIARAILRNPRLLVLDEATSALDPATEQAVSRTLAQLGHGRTVVAVTHRLTTIMGCDRIYVMNDGGVAESGTHAELVEHQGLYRQLWDKQTAVAVNAGGEATLRPALLASLPLFAALGAAIRDELAEQFVTMKFGADHQLFRAGDPGDAFYVIARGQVVIEISAAGKPSRQRVLSDGDSFGEIALLDEQPRSATARTRTETTFLVLPRQRFLEAIARAPGLAAELRKKAAAHLASDSAFRQ